MSELFNALQKLEKKNTSNTAPQPPPVLSEAIRRTGKIPYLKVVLLLLLIASITVVSLAVLWYQQNTSFFTNFTQQIEAPGKVVAPDVDEPLPDEVLQEVSEEDVAVTDGELNLPPPVIPSDYQATEEGVGGAKSEEYTGRPDPAMGKVSIMDSRPQDMPKLPVASSGGGKQPEQASETMFGSLEKERNHTQHKRLICRAEKLRLQGDAQAALGLYKQAWELEADPALANNLAAILIRQKEYREAERYLQKGLKLAPVDRDLLFNLNIVRSAQVRAGWSPIK
jgi:tetratricopeptide (TPR) repeat protein